MFKSISSFNPPRFSTNRIKAQPTTIMFSHAEDDVKKVPKRKIFDTTTSLRELELLYDIAPLVQGKIDEILFKKNKSGIWNYLLESTIDYIENYLGSLGIWKYYDEPATYWGEAALKNHTKGIGDYFSPKVKTVFVQDEVVVDGKTYHRIALKDYLNGSRLEEFK